MKRQGVYLPLLLLAIVGLLYAWVPAPPAEAGGREVVDARGTRVQVPLQAQRILGTSTAIDSALLALVEPERLIAVSRDSRSPLSNPDWQQARRITAIIERNPEAESIVALQPDLVFLPDYTEESMAASLRALGISTVVVTTPYRVEEVETLVRQVGAACGEPEETERVIASYRRQVAASAERAQQIPEAERRTVLMISSMVGYGGTGSLFAAGNRTAGLLNAAEAAGIPDHTAFTEERMLLMDPDILFVPYYDGNSEKQINHILADPALQTLSAVRERRVTPIRPAYVYNSSLRLSDAIAATQALGYPEYFPTRAEFYRTELQDLVRLVQEERKKRK